MSLVRIVVDTPQASGDVDGVLSLKAGGAAPDGIARIGQWIEGLLTRGGSVILATNAVAASLNGTFTGDPTAGQALTINGVTFTARASGAVANEFNIATGANAAPLAAAINASVTAKIKNQVKATVVSAQVIKLEAVVPGTGGNLFTVTENLDNFTLAGGATAMAGGTEGTQVTVSAGR